jgi:hypothetical protein
MEKICKTLDKKMKEILVNADSCSYEEVFTIRGDKINVPKLNNSYFLTDTEVAMLKTCNDAYFAHPVKAYLKAEDAFGVLLFEILRSFCIPEEFAIFFRTKENISSKFKFLKLYKVFHNLPINVSSTIMEVMFGLRNPVHRISAIKFFLKKLHPSFIMNPWMKKEKIFFVGF